MSTECAPKFLQTFNSQGHTAKGLLLISLRLSEEMNKLQMKTFSQIVNFLAPVIFVFYQ
jgi:hypothetical protein